MKASNIIERARSLADMQNSKAITWDDELNSLNEAYKLIYNKLSESDDDFFTKEYFITDISPYLSSTPYNYMIPLPADFYKLRTVSYNWNGQWSPMDKMPLNIRHYNSTRPYYRLRNSELWVKTSSFTMPQTIQIVYYPPPIIPSVPDFSSSFSSNVPYTTTLASVATIKDANNLYRTSGNNIVLYQANKTGTTTAYSGSATISYPVFYKGLLYFYEGNDLKYSDGTSATTIKTGISNTVPFSIDNNIIYYTNGVNTFSNSWLGGAETTLFTGDVRYNIKKLGPSSYAYIKAGNIEIDGTVITSATYLNYPYYNKDDNVYELVNNIPSIWREGVQIASSFNGRITGMNVNDRMIESYSTAADTVFDYPNNSMYEIMSYQAAIDFKRKYDSVNEDLNVKLGQLWDAFLHSIIRSDEYKPEKIQNVYPNTFIWGNY